MMPSLARDLTQSQIKQINKDYQTAGKIIIKPTRKQIEGGFLGTVASIGIPMAISLVSKMFGSGLQVDRGAPSNTRNVYVPPPPPSTHGEGYPYRSPPFFGTWEDQMRNPIGMGVQGKKKSQRQRTSFRKKQPIQLNSHSGNHFVIGEPTVPPMTPSLGHANQHFVIKPLSNFDLMDWVNKLGIKHFRGIYSRDGLPRKIRKECGIINLDDIQGAGTHWVCYRNLVNVIEYFDSFGLIMPNEALKYFRTARKQIVYSIDEIQNRSTVLCGYWCLYYLFERPRGKSIIDVIHNPHFDDDNSDFIKAYFSGGTPEV